MPVLLECNNVTAYDKAPGEDSEKLLGLSPVYRLDVPASGILLLSDGPFEGEILYKTYVAVCTGKFERNCGFMEDLLFHDSRSNRTFPVKRERKGVKRAELAYKVLGYLENENLSLVSVKLVTGRTHQIRAQFAARKHPLAGDGKYGSRIKCGLALDCHDIMFVPASNADDAGKSPVHLKSACDRYPFTLFPKELR